MEVGAVKQAFNNEVISLKKNLNQAKIQVIHKLTRKAKTLTQKKVPDHLKQRFKRKAESAVNEVLAIKKIKPKDLAKFIVTHTKELNQYLNNPKADQEKACARLLLHKSLKDKHKFIRGRFSNVPVEDLFMSRQERRKLKKEAKEKKNNKGKDKKVVNSEGDWDVEDVAIGEDSKQSESSMVSDDKELPNDIEESCDNESDIGNSNGGSDADSNEIEAAESDSDVELNNATQVVSKEHSNPRVNVENDNNKKSKIANPIPGQHNSKIHPGKELPLVIKRPDKNIVKKESNKNKNLNEKLLTRKFKKDEEDSHVTEAKIVDPFFITSTGENYMSVAEPRQPDEVKEIHKQGNRKLRRAVMFGNIPKFKPRRDHFNSNFNSEEGYDKSKRFSNKFDTQAVSNDRNNYGDKKYNNNRGNSNSSMKYNAIQDEKPEKLHPSWEAKKKKSGILPFQGKKIVFDS